MPNYTLVMDDVLYLALIGDVPGSRERKDRERFQSLLIQALAEVNSDLGPDALASPLTLTAGDEIQALLRDPVAAVTAIQELTDRQFGSWKFPQLVFGLGHGPLSTGSIPAAPCQAPNPALLDGPCFHLARQAQEAASRARVWVRWQGLEPTSTQALDAIFDLSGAIRSTWTANQAKNTYQVRRFEHQKDWALELGVSPSVISESLKAAHHEAVLAGEAAARSLLAASSPSGRTEGNST